jgi:hypothetical protein
MERLAEAARWKRTVPRAISRFLHRLHFKMQKKSATHKQIGAAETSSLMDKRPKTRNYSSFIEVQAPALQRLPDLRQLFSES